MLFLGDCTSKSAEGDEICDEMGSSLSAWYSGGAVEDSVMEARYEEALSLFLPEYFSDEGLDVEVVGVTVGTEGAGKGGPGKVISGENSAGKKVKAPVAVGAASAGLAALLLLLLLARRNRDPDEVSHLKLEDSDEQDGTFIREFESVTSEDSPYKSDRIGHIVGEADSVISGWTGFNSGSGSVSDAGTEEPSGKLGHPIGDVHICSSATCEVCEKRRQMGIQFIPTCVPVKPKSLPSDASREYIAEDTVDL